MDLRDVQARLNGSGFPCGRVDGIVGPSTRAAVYHFQAAYNGGPWLATDGDPGPKTQAALAQLPRLSPNFSVAELRSHGDGTCYVRRELLVALELLRLKIGRPLLLVDAYRDPAHNRAVGSMERSQHPLGLAADTSATDGLTVALVESCGVFSGIGDKDGRVLHVDVRHAFPATNFTHSTPQAPARWHY